jgi:hypothetical protein
MEKRRSNRFKDLGNLTGKLLDVVEFKVKNISLTGMSFITSLNPNIGANYMVFLFNKGERQSFTINIVRAEVSPDKEQSELKNSKGLNFIIGAEFLNIDDTRTNFIKSLIGKEQELEPGQMGTLIDDDF